MWKGSGRSLGRTLLLENGKFILFVLTPVATASIFSSDAAVAVGLGLAEARARSGTPAPRAAQGAPPWFVTSPSSIDG